MLSTPTWKSFAIAGSAMPTTVASSDAMPDPSTVAARTQRPWAVRYRRPTAATGTLVTRGKFGLVATQVREDVSTELAGLPAVDHRPRDGAGEQRAEGERAAANPGGQAPAQLPRQWRPGQQDHPAGHRVDAAPVRPGVDVGPRPLGGGARGGQAGDLVELRDQLDLDPDGGECFRGHFGREGGEDREGGPGARGPA